MKPDKHKKKKNAAYVAKKNLKPKGHAKENDEKKRNFVEDHKNTVIVSEKPHASNRIDGFQQQVPIPNQSFSRRKIESNWDRYEDYPEESERVEKRGADFNFLINQTIASSFRFKDEDVWENEATEEDVLPVLSLDCQVIAERLQSIPLPEKLGIPREDFDPELLGVLEQDAGIALTNNKNSNLDGSKSTRTIEAAVVDNITKDLESVLSINSTEIQNRTTVNDLDITKKNLPSNILKNESLSHSTGNPVSNTSKIKTQSLNGASEDKKIMNGKNEEDELDFLLSLDTPSHNATTELDSFSSDLGSVDVSEIKQENQSKPQENSNSISAPPVSQSPAAVKDPSESLDDWLDSMLDD